MKIKHLILLTTTAVAASSLSSCKEEPYIITAEEEFTRNFIKEFGLIDPNQDWNLAEGSTVTVKVGSTPAEVKAYMNVDNTYYLVADLQDVAGDVKIPFDKPEGTNDIMVKINGTRYYTTPGGTVDPNAPTSRGLLNEGTNTFAGVKVTVEENPQGRKLTLEEGTMLEALETLPESDNGGNTFAQTNFGKVTDDFVAYAEEFYVFPEFFHTDGWKDNIIGIYWYVDKDTDGAEEVICREPGWGTTPIACTEYIIKVPFFNNPKDFLTPYDVNDQKLDWPDSGEESKQAVVADASYYLSEGVHVYFNKKIKFGFYLQQGENVMYSESRLNSWVYFDDVEGNWYQASYVATFTNGTDTEENTKRHLCFEDWYAGYGSKNFDLNDMVFRVYGFDYITSGSLGGKIDDLETEEDDDDDNNEGGDEGDPTPPDVTITETDTPYSWLLAVEDLGATDDFDFNDIIVGITSVTVKVEGDITTTTNRVKGNSSNGLYKKVEFKALAAGGTRKAYIFYNGELLYPNNGKGNTAENAEWHQWFDNGYSSTKMINTGRDINNAEGATCTIYFGVGENGTCAFTLDNYKAAIDAGNSVNSGVGFQIGIDTDGSIGSTKEISKDCFDEGGNYMVQQPDAGKAPQMFLIPDSWENGGKWYWPEERAHISDCYKNFVNWVKYPDDADAINWYKNADGNVCRPTK